MYKILAIIMILIGALIWYSTRAAALPMTQSPDYISRNNDTTLSVTSTALSGNAMHNELPLVTKTSLVSGPSTGSLPHALHGSENELVTIQPLGMLDSIAWNSLEQPGYETVFSQLLVLPTTNEIWPRFLVAGNDGSAINLQSPNYSLQSDDDQAYTLLQYIKAYGEAISSCTVCRVSLNTISLFTSKLGGGLGVQAYDDQPPILDCARCHATKPAQINLQIHGVQ